MIYSHYQGARGEQKSCLDGKHVSLGRNNVVFNESLCPDLPLWCSASTSISTDAQIKVCPRHTLAMLTISAHFGSIGFFWPKQNKNKKNPHKKKPHRSQGNQYGNNKHARICDSHGIQRKAWDDLHITGFDAELPVAISAWHSSCYSWLPQSYSSMFLVLSLLVTSKCSTMLYTISKARNSFLPTKMPWSLQGFSQVKFKSPFSLKLFP